MTTTFDGTAVLDTDGYDPAHVAAAEAVFDGHPYEYLWYVLGLNDHDRICISHKPNGRWTDTCCTVAQARRDLVPTLSGRESWFGTCTNDGTDRKGKHSTRLLAVFADLDYDKPGVLPGEAAAFGVIVELQRLLGVKAAMIVKSGGGLQPWWPLLDGHMDTPEQRAYVEEVSLSWGVLVNQVAARHGSEWLDNVYDTARVLRFPVAGARNLKAEYGPGGRPVTCLTDPWNPAVRPVTLAEVRAVCEAHGTWGAKYPPKPRGGKAAEADKARAAATSGVTVTARAGDTATAGDWVPTGTIWRAQTCNYAKTATAAWATDITANPHSWQMDKATKLAAMALHGCLTQADHAAAVAMLDDRLDALRAALGSDRGDTGEAERGHRKALQRMEGLTPEAAAEAELNGHCCHRGGSANVYTLAGVTVPQGGAQGQETAAGYVGGLPAVHPDLPAFTARAEQERRDGVQHGPTFGQVNPAELMPADLRGLHATVFGPRAAALPLSVRDWESEAAEAIAMAVEGKILLDAERSQRTNDVVYAWAGDHFARDADAGLSAVKGLLHPRQLSSAGEAQAKIQVIRFRKPDEDEAEEQRAEARQAAAARGEVFEEKKFKATLVPYTEYGWVTEGNRTSRIARAVVHERRIVVPETRMFDADPMVLGCHGAHVVLTDEGHRVIPPDPRYRVTKRLGTAYDPSHDGARWRLFMAQFQREEAVRNYLQELVGAALKGAQDCQVLPVLEGAGGNGKGTFVDVMLYFFGSYGVQMTTRVLTAQGGREHSVNYMPLLGARFAVFDEVPGVQLDQEVLKKLSGGGTFTARGIAEAPTTWTQTHMPWLTTNNELAIAPGNRRAIRRRVRNIPCEGDFSGLDGGAAAISGYADSLWATDAAGILNWALEGWDRFAQRGFVFDEPASITRATDAAMTKLSSWSAFAAEAFTVTRDHDLDTIEVSDIWQTWKYYRGDTTDQGHSRPNSDRAIPKAMEQELHGVRGVQSRGSRKASITGVRWSVEGLLLREEMGRRFGAYNPFPV